MQPAVSRSVPALQTGTLHCFDPRPDRTSFTRSLFAACPAGGYAAFLGAGGAHFAALSPKDPIVTLYDTATFAPKGTAAATAVLEDGVGAGGCMFGGPAVAELPGYQRESEPGEDAGTAVGCRRVRWLQLRTLR